MYTEFVITLFLSYRPLKNLLQLFKKHLANLVKFGSKLEHMMLEENVSRLRACMRVRVCV